MKMELIIVNKNTLKIFNKSNNLYLNFVYSQLLTLLLDEKYDD